MKPISVHQRAPFDVPLTATGARHRLSDYIALTKPRLNALVIATSGVGFYVAARGSIEIGTLLHTVMGAALVAGGAAGLNQVQERETDRLMDRTRRRPVPDGRLAPGDARTFSVVLVAAGLAQLASGAHVAAALVALTTLVTYVWIYTPLKRRWSDATLVGAIPGALPPLIGWAAARGALPVEAWTLFAIVFLWQIPHFYAIAWMYREDYRKAGFAMLPVVDTDGRRTGRQATLFAALLVPAALSPSLAGLTGVAYLIGALVLSLCLLALSWRFARDRSVTNARWLFYGSITYLPVLWALLLFDLAA